jgi:hypothetical protein
MVKVDGGRVRGHNLDFSGGHMFCPNCGIEYRAGFTHCNDCDVDLVEELPAEGEAGAAEGEGSEEDVELLWHGTQGGVFNEITLALDEAKIQYNREKLDARLTFGSGAAPLSIWVPAAQFEAARKVLEETLTLISQPVAGADAPTAEGAGEADDEDETPAIVEEPHPDDATAEVWSGADESMAQFLKSALAANGIGCCVAEPKGGPVTVRVLPEDEGRAARIVRQVVEGTTPQ